MACGSSGRMKVIAEKGSKGPIYNRLGDPRNQVTCTTSVNAAGGVLVRIVHAGERVMCGPGKKYLKDLPPDDVLGEVKFSVTESGYVQRHIFLKVLEDIYEYCLAHEIPFPIILYVDGFGGHFSLEISEYCREKDIILLGKFFNK